MYPKLNRKKDYITSLVKTLIGQINYLSNISKCFLKGNDYLWIFMKKVFIFNKG